MNPTVTALSIEPSNPLDSRRNATPMHHRLRKLIFNSRRASNTRHERGLQHTRDLKRGRSKQNPQRRIRTNKQILSSISTEPITQAKDRQLTFSYTPERHPRSMGDFISLNRIASASLSTDPPRCNHVLWPRVTLALLFKGWKRSPPCSWTDTSSRGLNSSHISWNSSLCLGSGTSAMLSSSGSR